MSAVKKLIDELKKKENPDKPKVAPKPAALDLQPRRDNLDVPNAPRVRPISVSELKKNYLLSPQEPSPKPSALSPNPAFVPDQKPQPVIAAPAPMPKPKVNLVEQKPIAVSSPPVNFPKQAPIIAPPTHTPFAKPRPPTKSDEHKHSTIVAIAQEQKAGNSIASTQGKIEEHQPVPKSAPAPAPKPRLLTKLEDNNLPAKPVNTPSVIINSSHLVSNERGTSFISAEVASAITLVSKTPTSAISSAVVVNPISTHEQSAPASSTDKATTTAIPDRVSSPKPAPKPLPKSRTIAIHSAASRQNSADSGNPTLSRDNSFVKAPAPVLDSSKLSQDNSKVVAGRELQPAPVLLSKPSPVPSPMASRSATTVVKETINQPSNQRPLSPEVFPLSRDSKVSELKKSYNNIDKTIPKPDSLHNSVLSMNSERNRSGSMNRKDEKPTSRVASQLNLRGDKDVKRVGELEGELASLKSQLDALQIQLDASRLNYKLEVESLNEKHQEELEKVRAEVSAKKEEEFRQSNAKDDTALNALQLQNDTLKLLLEKANHDKAVITKQFQDSETAISFIKNSFITQKSELETLRKTNADLNFVISQVSPSSASSPSRKRLSAGPGELQFAPPSIRPQPHSRGPSTDKKAASNLQMAVAGASKQASNLQNSASLVYSSQPNISSLAGTDSYPNSASASPAPVRRQKSIIPLPPPMSIKKSSSMSGNLSASPSLSKLQE